jgi:hypothetical protein
MGNNQGRTLNVLYNIGNRKSFARSGNTQKHLRKPLELWAYDRGYLVMWPGRQEYIDWCRGKRPL